MKHAKAKKEPKPKKPVELATFLPFGKYKGKQVQNILHDYPYIVWFANTSKRTISAELKAAIINFQNLTK